MRMKLSDYVWSYLENYGVKHVFMLPGGGAMHLVDSLGKNKNIEYITLLHEQACAMASETYSRIANHIGVTLVTTGPGGTNAITGVAAAWLESTPCLVISGQVKTSDLKKETGVRQKGNQEIGIVEIVKSITKYAVTITDPNYIKYHLDKSLFLAINGRPGPVWIDIPLDVQATVIEVDELKSFDITKEERGNSFLLDEKIMKTIELLKAAKRPVMLVGQGIERGSGREIFRELVKMLKIPVLTSWIATELIEFDNEYNMGKPGMVAGRYSNFTMQNSDCLIAIGTRLDPSMIGYSYGNFAPNAKKVIVDIDEKEIDKIDTKVDVKVVSDATKFILELVKKLKNKKVVIKVDNWLNRCKDWKRKYPVMLDEYKEDKGNVNPYYFIEKLSEELAEDDIILPGSSGASIDVFWLAFKNKKNQRLLSTGSLGAMGYGIPSSIGGCLASGKKRTICIEGDGSLQLNIQELASIVGMNLPIKIFVFNNGGYLSIMNMQKAYFNGNFVGAEKSSNLFIPNIVDVAKAYGLKVYSIYNHEDLGEKIRKVINTKGPVLCNILMSQDFSIQPKVVSEVCEDGTMKSRTLEDLWPFLDKEELAKNMTGYLGNDMLEINNIHNKFDLFKKEYEDNKFEVIIYGCGRGAEGAIKLLNKYNIPIQCIIDKDKNKQGKFYLEIPIMSLENMIQKYKNVNFGILIASPKYEKEIITYLENYINKYRIYSFECELYYLCTFNIEEYKKYLSENLDKFEELYFTLHDELSKKTLEKVIKGRLSGELDYFRDVFTHKQYFCDDIIKLTEEEIIVDVGASCGDTLKDIVNYTNKKFKKIYCLEPDKMCLVDLVNIKESLKLENVTIIDKGAWNRNEQLNFLSCSDNVSSKIVEDSKQQNEKNNNIYTIETICIDDVIMDEVTFIKMDIEGAEIKALNGAKHIIRKYKPKLAICVYHRNEDILEISQYVRMLVPEYKIYLRHHGINGTDTVLYAIL